MAKRGNKEGSVYRRKDGRWAATVSLGWRDGKRRRKTFYGNNREDVARRLAAAIRDHDLGIGDLPERQSVAEYLRSWLEVAGPTVGPATIRRYEEYVRLHAIPVIGQHRLARLTPQHLQSLYGRKLDEGLSPTTVSHLHAVLHLAFGQALRLGLILRNPSDAVDPPRKEHHEMRPLTPDESRQLLKVARGDRLGALYVLALTTGMRQGELLGLHWRDVDLERGKLQVRGNLRRTMEIAETKRKKSRRQISLTSIGVEALKRHGAQQAEERLALGRAWKDPELVFTNVVGGYVDANNLRHRAFPKLLERAELPRIRFHDLRHSAATLLLSLGVHPKVVQELLGHSQISVTLDTYSHILPDMQKDAMTELDGLLAM